MFNRKPAFSVGFLFLYCIMITYEQFVRLFGFIYGNDEEKIKAAYEQLLVELNQQRDEQQDIFQGSLEGVISNANGGHSDANITNMFTALAYKTHNDQFFHEMTAANMQWQQLLNQRDYDRGLQLDERAYQEGLRDENRAYNAPNALLQRLMATGMSRSAALSLLGSMSGGAGSSSVGSAGVPFGGSVPSVSSSADSSAQFSNYAAGAANIVNSLEGLASIAYGGISAHNAVQQAAIAKNEVNASNMQNSARQSVGDFYNALYARGKNGDFLSAPTQQDSLSLEGLLKFAGSVPASQNPMLHKFMNSPQYNGMTSNPYAISLLASQFGMVSNAQRNKLDEDILTQSHLLQLQERYSKIQLDSSILQYNWDTSRFADYNITRDAINAFTLEEFKDKLELLMVSRTPEQLEFRKQKLRNDNEFNAIATGFLLQKEKLLNADYNNDPAVKNMINVCYLLTELGIVGETGNVLRASAFGAGTVQGAGNAFIDSLISSYDAVQEPFRKFDSFIGDQVENAKKVVPGYIEQGKKSLNEIYGKFKAMMSK